ncbi:MAG: hypothetical protein UT33_C0007G0010 [Candidatus Peregrinibacteria bacterium GW2011_GWC2_39_14]|nr:MAG: hypothetical protein US92_C0002G0011 [Candidatus Peregrinibacteria bacterium GW2011_GWA2_38_36]KKR06822.1 MAG: hypothetical protein UT33_C0007G0010 [Candidatus Peregrinibacteria bacterium GW2011_GWC2_39_14]
MADDKVSKGPGDGGDGGNEGVGDGKKKLSVPLELEDELGRLTGAVGEQANVTATPTILRDSLPSLPEEREVGKTGLVRCAVLIMKLIDQSADEKIKERAEDEGGVFERSGSSIRVIFRGERVEAGAVLVAASIRKLGISEIDNAAVVLANGNFKTKKGRIFWDTEGGNVKHAIDAISDASSTGLHMYVTDKGFLDMLGDPRNADRVGVESFSMGETGVFGIKSIEKRYGRLLVGGPKGIYGREGEMGQMEELLSGDKIAQGTAKLTLTARAGVGKTKFIKHALEKLSSCHKNSSTLYVAASEPKKAKAFSFLTGFGGFIPRLLEVAKSKVLDADKMPVYQELAGLASGTSELLQDVSVLQHKIKILMGKIAEVFPLFIAFDDQQWVDDASAAVLRGIFKDPIANVAVIGATRIQEGENPPKALQEVFAGSKNIELNNLNLIDASHRPTGTLRGLVRDMLEIKDEGEDFPISFYTFLAEKSKGHALKLVEGINLLIKGGFLQKGSVLCKRGYKNVEIPETEEALLESRISKLPRDQIFMLLNLCMLGPSSTKLLSAIFTNSVQRKAILGLESNGIIQREKGYGFDLMYPTIREVMFKVYGEDVEPCARSLIEPFKRIMAEGSFLAECTSYKLYELAQLANDLPTQMERSMSAGKEALSRYDNEKAIEIFEFARGQRHGLPDDGSNFGIYTGLAKGNSQMGDYSAATAHLESALGYLNPDDVDMVFEFHTASRDAFYSAQDIKGLEEACERSSRIVDSKEKKVSAQIYDTERFKVDFDIARCFYLKAASKDSEFVPFSMVRIKLEDLQKRIGLHSYIDPDGRFSREIKRFIGLTHYLEHGRVDSDAAVVGNVKVINDSYCNAIVYLEQFLAEWRESPSGTNPKAVISALRCCGYAKAMLGDVGYSVLFDEAATLAIKYGDYSAAADALNIFGGAEVDLYRREGGEDVNLLHSALQHFKEAEREMSLLNTRPSWTVRAVSHNKAQTYYSLGLLSSDDESGEMLAQAFKALEKDSIAHRRGGSDHLSRYIVPLIALLRKADDSGRVDRTMRMSSFVIGGEDIAESIGYIHGQIDTQSNTSDGFTDVLADKLEALFYMLQSCDTANLTRAYDAVAKEINSIHPVNVPGHGTRYFAQRPGATEETPYDMRRLHGHLIPLTTFILNVIKGKGHSIDKVINSINPEYIDASKEYLNVKIGLGSDGSRLKRVLKVERASVSTLFPDPASETD